MPATALMAKNSKSSLLILFSVVTLDLVGFGVVIPILPFYAKSYGASATTLGLILTSYAFMQFIFSPVWGKVSDKIGRKKVLLGTMLGSIVGLIILGTAHSLTQLFVGRLISGMFAANISIASAYVTDITTDENRAKGMGLIGAAFGVGFILGPALGGMLSGFGYEVPILTAAALSLCSFVYAYFKLAESHQLNSTLVRPSRASLLADPKIRRMCILNLLFTLGVTQLESIFAFFMMDRFGYDAKHVAYIYVLMAFIMVSIQGGMIKKLAKRFGEKQLMLFGCFFLAISLSSIPWIAKIGILLVPLIFSSIGRGISQPSMLSLVSKFSPDNFRGSVMGAFQSSASLARTFGPVLAGWLYDRNQAWPFYFATVMLSAVVIYGLALPKPYIEVIER